MQRRIARRFGMLAVQVARDLVTHSWLEGEPYVLNELARFGTLYEATEADRYALPLSPPLAPPSVSRSRGWLYYSRITHVTHVHPVVCSLSVARRDIYGPHDPLEDLVNSWIDHLRAVAGKHRWSYDNDVALLDDMALARIACVEATMLPMRIFFLFPRIHQG